jgi:hypothetical protein
MKLPFATFFKRVAAFIDQAALLLIIPCLIIIYQVDEPMAKTLIEWITFSPVLGGVAVIIFRIVFHRVDLKLLIEQTEKGSVAAAILSSAVMIFVAILFAALVLWAKA